MVVDDSRIMRGIVKKTFEQLNIPVRFLEAGNGEDALVVLTNNNVDLVLLDWNIPFLSGIDFLRKVRSMDNYKNIPIVMVTSEAAKLNLVEALKAGATAYITKPFNTKTFMEKISKITF